ncbi:hypothetical protein PR048_004945 [Dryococelus australis]|uniref:nitric-oxide synthase (NADPH) n=1 Tax=Dryococelus australis TaxID=614101 RepID=A0ABQ9I6T8_9NEOP|nr:hypothetical protein PR048_004945 [Dryococelus australis]
MSGGNCEVGPRQLVCGMSSFPGVKKLKAEADCLIRAGIPDRIAAALLLLHLLPLLIQLMNAVLVIKVCCKLGWQGRGTQWDILPLVLSTADEGPHYFELPPSLILEVQLSHPTYDWLERLGLRWYGLPAVSGMLFDCGGLEFTAAPFNGWYMSTEIGCRDLCDSQRYNYLEVQTGIKPRLDELQTQVVTAQKQYSNTQRHLAELTQNSKEWWRVKDMCVETQPRQPEVLWRLKDVLKDVRQVLHHMNASQFAVHPGVLQTTRNEHAHFHWPGATRDLCKYVCECITCNQFKSHHADGVMQQQPRVPTEPFETISLDLDNCQKVLYSSHEQLIFETEFYPCWGYPKILLTDSSTQLMGRQWHDLGTNLTEHRNQDIKMQLHLRVGKNPTTWVEHLPAALLTIRRCVNLATGQSPITVLQGHELPLPGEFVGRHIESTDEAEVSTAQW